MLVLALFDMIDGSPVDVCQCLLMLVEGSFGG